MEQTGSLFTPHPLLPHGNTCYYSWKHLLLFLNYSQLFSILYKVAIILRIILNSLPLLLFSELFSILAIILRIILNSLRLLLFSELFRHNYLRPICNAISSKS